nr:COP9 signalosome complex subunit 8 [Hymenolepis microstoma]
MNSIDANVMDVGSQIIQLENLEMENGILTPEQYLELLCLYLRLDRIMDAKFMWKRVPDSMKTPESLLRKVWGLTVFLLKKQNSEFLSVCQELLKSSNIPPSILPRISAVYQRVLCSTVDSIRSSYSSISLEKLSTLLSLAPNEAAILMRGWTLSSDGLYLIEPSNVHQQQQLTGSDNSKLMSEFLSTLTEFSSFMENV